MALDLIASINLTDVENKINAAHNLAQIPYERGGKFLFVPGAGFVDVVFQRDPSTGKNKFALNHWNIACDTLLETKVVAEDTSDVSDLQLFSNAGKNYVTITVNKRAGSNGYYADVIETYGPVSS